MTDDNSILVYSTEHPVPRKEKTGASNSRTPPAPSKNKATVRLDRKSRGGKSVTLIEGLQLSAENSEKLLKQLKAKLGAGGAVKNGALEIQGNHCEAVAAELSGLGHTVNRRRE